MSQRSSNVPLAGAAAFFSPSRWRHSGQTASTAETASTGERGFQKLGGRKLPSVLTSGGDGYGGPFGTMTTVSAGPQASATREGTLSEQSFYRDSQGFYGGPGSPSGTTPAGPSGYGPDRASAASEIAVIRPSPARTPVTSQGGFRPATRNVATPTPRQNTPTQNIRDDVGRSHASFDGSRTSKFSEGV